MAAMLGFLFVVVMGLLYYTRVIKLGIRTSCAIHRFLKGEVTPVDEHDVIGRKSFVNLSINAGAGQQ
eukprot:9088185-Ditylum_brightwellii.AAC.1